jgi:hypothetical protein
MESPIDRGAVVEHYAVIIDTSLASRRMRCMRLVEHALGGSGLDVGNAIVLP